MHMTKTDTLTNQVSPKTWKNDSALHAKLWHAANQKLLHALSEQDLQIAFGIFMDRHHDLLEKKADEKTVFSVFNAWLLACSMKDNTALIPWFIEEHGEELSGEEKEVLQAANCTVFDALKVKGQTPGQITLTDTAGKEFAVETVDLPPVEKGTAIMARLISKGPDRWFAPGRMLVISDTTLFDRLASHRRFRDSWNKYLVGFFNYLQKEEKLTEKTADKHADNALLLTMFLEEKIDVDSFKKVTKPMLKDAFRTFCKKYIFPKPNMDKVYYSLFKFFSYLEEKGEKNSEALAWLRERI